MSVLLKKTTKVKLAATILVTAVGIATLSYISNDRADSQSSAGSIAQRLMASIKFKHSGDDSVNPQKPGSQIDISVSGPATVNVNDEITLNADIKLLGPATEVTYQWLLIKGAETQTMESLTGTVLNPDRQLHISQKFIAKNPEVHIALEVKSKQGSSISGSLAGYSYNPGQALNLKSDSLLGLSKPKENKAFEENGKPLKVFQ